MLLLDRVLHGIHFKVAWFVDEPLKEKGIITYKESKIEKKDAHLFETLVNDLTKEPEEIKSGFAKNCKYEVNRAEREDVTYRILAGKEISDEDIDTFVGFFTRFWESKNIPFSDGEQIKRDFRLYRDIDALVISIGTVSGEDAIYHTYIHDEKRARLWHSASLYRLLSDEDDSSRKIIGMGNRYLHFRDMIYFKEKGLTEYDWGGAGKGEDVASITKFKEAFGGLPEQSYEFEEVRGIKAHLFKFLINVMDDVMF